MYKSNERRIIIYLAQGYYPDFKEEKSQCMKSWNMKDNTELGIHPFN
jgi:hypothetical protein